MQLTFQGKPVTLIKDPVQKGNKLPEFTIVKNDLQPIRLKDKTGVRIFLSVPSLDTGVCSLEVENFIHILEAYNDVDCYCVSMDLPFALDRWCQSKQNSRIVTASDYKDREFAKATGLYIEEIGLLARACIVINADNEITYMEVVKEISEEPNYDAVLNAISFLS